MFQIISVSPTSSCSISGTNYSGNMTTVPHSHLEILEATHRGLYKFNPRHHDELELEIGDPIYVQKECDDLWSEGIHGLYIFRDVTCGLYCYICS